MLRFHGSRDKQTFELVGHNSRLDALQAAILRVQLPHLEGWADGRRAAAGHYEAAGLGELVDLPRPRGRPRVAPLRRAPRPLRRAGGRAEGRRDRPQGLLPRADPPAAGDARVRARPPAARHRRGGAHPPRDPHEPRSSRASRPPRSSPRSAMRVWVDLTNSPHVLVMRPIVRALEQRGAEVLVTARDFAQTLELCERHGLCLRGDRPPPRRPAGRQGRRPAVALDGAAAVGARAADRHRARPRLQRRHRRRAAARHPELDGLRLRVGEGPAQRQLPAGAGDRRAGRDPARPAAAVRRAPRPSTAPTRA